MALKQSHRLPHPKWLSLNRGWALDRRSQIVYRIFTINLNAELLK